MQVSRPTSTRIWLSPLTGLLFFAIAMTGILMLFHVRLPGIMLLHELGGVLFVIVSGWHLTLNWRPFFSFCKQRPGRFALALGGTVIVLLFVLGLGHDERHLQHRRGHASMLEEMHR